MNQGKLEVVKPRRSNTGDGKSERQHFRNQQTKMNWNWVNLTQMIIISTTVGQNPLEELE